MSIPILIFLAIVGVMLLMPGNMILIVRHRSAFVIERFGRFHTIKHAGLQFKAPWPIDSVAGKVSLQQAEITDHVRVKTQDNVFISIPVHLQYRVLDTDVEKAFYQLADPITQIINYTLSELRSTINDMQFKDVFGDRSDTQDHIKSALTERFSGFGYTIENLLIDEPQPSDEVVVAFNRVIASVREKEAAHNEAEADRIKLVAKAQAQAEAMLLNGKGISDQRAQIAEGFRDAVMQMRDALPNVSEEFVVLHLTQLYGFEAMKEVSGNQAATIIIPSDGNMMGNIKDAVVTGAIAGASSAGEPPSAPARPPRPASSTPKV